MYNCGIVCEYNPFHTGHYYQLDKVHERGVDNIMCVMSGSFVQSGFPAFCDKAIRAKCAVMGGADAVIELPVTFSTGSAQIFAEGAVRIISAIKDIKYMAMGATADEQTILDIADIKIKCNEKFSAALKTELNAGKSYAVANSIALERVYSTIHPDRAISGILNDPNNMLCVEYITAIYRNAATVSPMIIKRLGARHNDLNASGTFISATAIRTAAADDRLCDALPYIPFCRDEILADRQNFAPDSNLYKSIAVYALKHAECDYIATLRNCSEGMEFLLKDNSKTYDFDKIINAVAGKRYSKKRIYRLFCDILFGIDKSMPNSRFCTRLLACKNRFDFSLLPDCVKTSNADIKSAASSDVEIKRNLTADERAVALYNTVSRRSGDYYNYSIIKV